MTRAPCDAAFAEVRSDEPPSTTRISSKRSPALWIVATTPSSSLRLGMTSESLGMTVTAGSISIAREKAGRHQAWPFLSRDAGLDGRLAASSQHLQMGNAPLAPRATAIAAVVIVFAVLGAG